MATSSSLSPTGWQLTRRASLSGARRRREDKLPALHTFPAAALRQHYGDRAQHKASTSLVERADYVPFNGLFSTQSLFAVTDSDGGRNLKVRPP